jgi:ABC-type metal ion transport system substrate-binding protein
MKTKHFLIAMTAVAAGAIVAACGGTKKTTDADLSIQESIRKDKVKEINRMYKSKMAEYKQEGWKLSSSSKTMEVALLEHYEKLYDTQTENKELVGEVSQCQSINVCKQMATNNALTHYASLARSVVRGRIASDVNADATRLQAEFDKMYAAYERLVSAEIRGVLTESYAIVKEDKQARQYKLFFVVNEEKAAAARIRALQRAAEETAVAQEYATKITDFVREGFELE